jgi:predicted AAA+ superfamily ATPase
MRGGFPRSLLADREEESHEWRRGFIQTFLERDLPQLGIKIGSVTLHRFWRMIAHYHGQIWNSSEFARSFGVADTTIRNYPDILSAALVIRQLPPWSENISKRQVKSPKVYIEDSGLLHVLLNLPTQYDLEGHPKVGASWEGFVIRQIVARLEASPEELLVRVEPELHKTLVIQARKNGKSLNAWIHDALLKVVKDSTQHSIQD